MSSASPTFATLRKRHRHISRTSRSTIEAPISISSGLVHSGPQSVSIVPQVSITLDSHAAVVPQTERHFNTEVHIKNVNHHPIDGTLQISRPVGWDITPREVELSKLPPQESRTIIDPAPASPIVSGPGGTLSAIVSSGRPQTRLHRRLPPRRLRHPPAHQLLHTRNPPRRPRRPQAPTREQAPHRLPPRHRRRRPRRPRLHRPHAHHPQGLRPHRRPNSQAFDTVILGVRTYNAHPDLHGAPTQALFDFARNGGNVVVQYQTHEFSAADAPYPLTLHGERVVDETAPVQLLDPSSPLLTTPNKITPADFNNWIEERGHGFLDTWDPHYTALTETHDPGAPAEHIEPEAPQRGGLITVQLGKGRWTYCAFALYRQLPEAVPGAFRLFVNLLNP